MNDFRTPPSTTRRGKPGKVIAKTGNKPSRQAGGNKPSADIGKAQSTLQIGENPSPEANGQRWQPGKSHRAVNFGEGLKRPKKQQKIEPASLSHARDNFHYTLPQGEIKELYERVEPTSGVLFSKLIEHNDRFGLPYLVACAPVDNGKWTAIDGSKATDLLAKEENIEGVVSPLPNQETRQIFDIETLQKDKFEFFVFSLDSEPVYLGNQSKVIRLMHQGSILCSLLGMNHLDLAEEEDIVRGIHVAAMRIAGHVLTTDKPAGRRLFTNLMNAPAANEGLAVSAALTCVADRLPNLLAAIVGLGVELDEEDEEGMTIRKRIKDVGDDSLKNALEEAVRRP